MSTQHPLTVLCIASYEKGQEFMREAKRQGCRVFLLTSQSIADADWPRESLDDIFLIPDQNKVWNMEDMIKGVSYLARRIEIDRIVALDDFDLEKAAALREHLRVPGMGETTTRYFRDKLAMRLQARDHGISVPEFVHALNYNRIQKYLETVPGPWMLKPRSEASSLGIKKIDHAHEVWPVLEQLGDKQSYYVLERFVPGEVFHVDSIVSEREIVFAKAHRYGHPPFDVAHGGGIFTSRSLEHGCQLELDLLKENAKVLSAMGLLRGVAHTEFIKAHEDGRLYFVETAARVGGAHIVDLIEAAQGINLWAEWAKIETGRPGEYRLPEIRHDYGGLIISLAKYEKPDTSLYTDPEIVWRMSKSHHVGLIVRSSKLERVEQLLNLYTERFFTDFYAFQPAPEKPLN